MKNHNIAVLGGDQRQVYLALDLAEQGWRVWPLLLHSPLLTEENMIFCRDFREAMALCSAVVLPVPVCREKTLLYAPLAEKDPVWDAGIYLSEVGKGTLLLGGAPNQEVRLLLSEKDADFIDLLGLAGVQQANAELTAEGAAALAIQEIPIALKNAHCMVIGCGKCGCALARVLNALGSHVTVTARRPEQLRWIAEQGWQPLDTFALEYRLPQMDMVFNTVPAPVISLQQLEYFHKDCVYFEIASAPGGVDLKDAQQKGIRTITAPGLPGKTAPKTAGKILSSAVQWCLRERGIVI